MKLELGGGDSPLGDGWVNMDVGLLGRPDVVHDLDVTPWPLADGSVDAVYSSHTLEHLRNPLAAVREVARVCREGAPVEIRVPHHLNPMAMCPGHVAVLSLQMWRQWCVEPSVAKLWAGSPRRLRLDRHEHTAASDFGELKRLLPGWSDDQILRLAPAACHEVRFFFTVVRNEVPPC